jgi:hypothetical protein
MRKLFVMMLALALGAGAQEAPPTWQQKVFDLKYADPNAVRNLLQSVMRHRETRVIENPVLRTVSVGTPDPKDMTTAEELVKRYDVPRGAAPAGNRNIELVAYMLMAATRGTAGEALPADLEPVAKQLKALFGYADLRLLDSALIRTREGVQAEASGNAGLASPDVPNATSPYQLRVAKAIVTPSERGNMIKLDGFRFGIRVPYLTGSFQPGVGSAGVTPLVSTQYQFSEVGFSTELDIREGQKVVVGKAKVDNAGSAFILVLTAKAID